MASALFRCLHTSSIPVILYERMYTYRDYLALIEHCMVAGYPTVEIGRTVLGAPIYAVFRGKSGAPASLVHAGIHAREHITCALVDHMIRESKPSRSGIWYIPMVNIDGVRISEGEDILRGDARELFRSFGDISLVKCNARAVDLNVNFDADFGMGENNLTYHAPENYIGEYPFSEPETRALRDFTLRVRPVIAISYHAKGEVIYQGYNGRVPYPDIAKRFSLSTGYPLQIAQNSCAGFKDWYILNSMGLGLTVEVGSDRLSHPIPYIELDGIYARNSEVPELLDEYAGEIYDKLYGGGDRGG